MEVHILPLAPHPLPHTCLLSRCCEGVAVAINLLHQSDVAHNRSICTQHAHLQYNAKAKKRV
jgi:hypothetical protein